MGDKMSWKEQAKQQRLFWEGKFKEYKLNHGGKSYKEFCRMQNLNYAQWIYWRKRLKNTTKSQATVVKKSESELLPDFWTMS